MSNLSSDWNNHWIRCEFCGTRFHASERDCSCLEDLEDCHCRERDWYLENRQILCSECGSKPGEELEEEEENEEPEEDSGLFPTLS